MFDSYGIHIGGLYLRYYGLIIMIGVIAATYLGRYMLRQMDEDDDLVWDGLIWLLVFGVIGARLYHVFTPTISQLNQGISTEYYLSHPLEILAVWQGGLGIPGGIAGGLLGMYIFTRRNNLSFSRLADAAAPAVALAQAIGRWGNFVNQELYGQPSDLPWAISIRPENRLESVRAFETFHPLFLYESLWNLANMFLLLWLFRSQQEKLLPGDLFLVYLITYPLGRFLLEFIRIDYVPLWGINFNQMLMLVVMIVSTVVLVYRHRRASAS
jgi:phosphatidylglycerol:prolipoprotein diacylglycerol transferase